MTLTGPHRNRLKWFREPFSFPRRYSIAKFEIRVSALYDYAERELALDNPPIFKLLNYRHWVCILHTVQTQIYNNVNCRLTSNEKKFKMGL